MAVKKRKPAKKKKKVPILPSVRLYRRIAAAFLTLTMVMLAVVLYLATVQAVISVETQEEGVEREFIARVMEEPQGSEDIPARIFSELVERSKTFEVNGDGEKIPAKARGTVTVTNESNVSQPLIATTRFLSESGVLFRLVDGVTVPANGDIQVVVAADEEGEQGEIEPTTFTIPGLNETKQKVIYGTSTEVMVGGSITKKSLTVEDLDVAQDELLIEIEAEMDELWRSEISGQLAGATILKETVEKRSDTEPGTETGTFEITTIARITGIYYDDARMRQIAELKLREHVPSGQVLNSVSFDEMIVTYNRHDIENAVAHFDVTVGGIAMLKTTSEILDKANLVGLTAPEAEEFLEANDTIKNVDIWLKPFWVKRVPKLLDHITINILQTQ
ncbi:hypothetical protein HOI83_04530 [Candidatus Uhrbacteria bacterium]|jgi:hypothetical protein|nr:hypothetical protein [Candidatus Uhrbacteria bacterium]